MNRFIFVFDVFNTLFYGICWIKVETRITRGTEPQSGRIVITYITLIYASVCVCVRACECVVDLLLLHTYVHMFA